MDQLTNSSRIVSLYTEIGKRQTSKAAPQIRLSRTAQWNISDESEKLHLSFAISRQKYLLKTEN